MKISDYTDLINQIVTKPEEAPALAKDLISNLKSDTDALDAAKLKIEEQDNKIKDLQNTNIKLFLAQTGQKKEDTVDNEPEHVTLEDLVSKMKGAFDELK